MEALVAALKRMGKFAGAGAALATLCVAVGALRTIALLLSGRHLTPLEADDARALAIYVGSFIAAGALFGLLRPILKGRVGIIVGCMLAGIVVMLGVGFAEAGGVRALDGALWVILPVFGMVFGAALAYGFLRMS
ncbi:MAG TPA: hypothetical protein VFW89_08835 [Gemmatimonadaceae bacterium]|nr:hypothetical protein [Gemmatimonadaceae bacterium]